MWGEREKGERERVGERMGEEGWGEKQKKDDGYIREKEEREVT